MTRQAIGNFKNEQFQHYYEDSGTILHFFEGPNDTFFSFDIKSKMDGHNSNDRSLLKDHQVFS